MQEDLLYLFRTFHLNVISGGVVDDAGACGGDHVLKNELAPFGLERGVPVVVLGRVSLSEHAGCVQPFGELKAYAFYSTGYLRYIAVGSKAAQGNALFEHHHVLSAPCSCDGRRASADSAADDGDVTEKLFSDSLHVCLLFL